MAYPSQVARIAREARKLFPRLALTLHFHDTRGMALANTLTALDEGIDRFDASLGGLGGCPYAPGASGNACTEDLVHMLNLMGYNTGISEQALLDIASGLPALIGHDLPSHLSKAGLRSRLHAVPTSC